MVAVAQSSPSPRSRRRKSRGPAPGGRSSQVPVSPLASAANPNQTHRPAVVPQVSSLRQSLALPLWLRLTLALQQGSSLVVLALGLLTLVSYGTVVYCQHRWGQNYEHLKALRQEELQLLAVQESLRQNLAAQADKSGLAWPTPDSMVFVESAAPRPAPTPPSPAEDLGHTPFPLGY